MDACNATKGARIILTDSSVATIYGIFGDCYLAAFGLDIREKRSFLTVPILRMVQCFVGEYGKDDSERIVRQLFRPPHDGRCRGSIVGTAIFSKKYRWLANQLLTEDSQADGAGWEDW